MDTNSQERLHRVWEHLMHMRVYSYRKEIVEDIDWLIEDYKRLDNIVEREYPSE